MGIDLEGPVVVGGKVARGFDGVREAFERNFAHNGEVGAACAVYHEGRLVVDLWGGTADQATGASYGPDTLQLVFSSTKGPTAACAHLLAQRGELDLDAPVAHYWPEFAAAGKGSVPVRWLLCHKAGLPYVATPLTRDEALAWGPAVEALAAQEPEWEPGTAHGYHAITYGWLVGEVVRRVTGRSLGAFFADEVAGPLGLEFWVGLPDEHQARVAPLTSRGPRRGGRNGARTGGAAAGRAGGHGAPAGGQEAGGAGSDGGAGGNGAGDEDGNPPSVQETIEALLGPGALILKALGGTVDPVTGEPVFVQDGVFNRPEVRAAELPAANGVTNARSLARFYAGVVGPVEGGGGPLLSAEQLAVATRTETEGADKVLFLPTTFGLGFMTSSEVFPYGGPRSFGHTGAGGSVGFADPEHGLGFAYVMNRMTTELAGDVRSGSLIKAAYEAIGVTPTHVHA